MVSFLGEGRSEQLFAFPRSTFCSIIAQLTEETQPLFETTLKSRAVSEDSDVRFTCIVTGNEIVYGPCQGLRMEQGPGWLGGQAWWGDGSHVQNCAS